MKHQTVSMPVFATCIFVMVAILNPQVSLARQDDSATGSDFGEFMKGAWKQVSEAWNTEGAEALADSLQRAYGWQFFDYWREYSDSPVGDNAGWQAFLMWSNAGAADDFDRALERLPDDAELFSRVLDYASAAYLKTGRRTDGDLVALFTRLGRRLTHPASRSAVLLFFARRDVESGRSTEAAQRYQEIVNLDARPFYVDQALGALHEMESLNAGQLAPSFEATTVTGAPFKLADQSGPVLLVFWSTWCGPCMPEIAHTRHLWDSYRHEGLQIVGVALEDDATGIRAFASDHGMGWPLIADGTWGNGAIAALFNVVGIPNTYLLDRDHMIVAKHLRGQELIDAVATLMETERR